MFLNTLQKEPPGLILNTVKHHFYGITSMLVSSYLPCINFHHKYLILLFPLVHFKDVEFGRLQARDMLQHLWTGPVSNAAIDVVQGSRSVEVRAVGVTKVSGSIQLLILMDGFFIFSYLGLYNLLFQSTGCCN
jgi:hypothetical protein